MTVWNEVERHRALERWRDDLAAWAIPDHILSQATEPPWAHPVAMFTAGDDFEDTVSARIARQAVEGGGSVLDVGSGGGRSSLGLVPPATAVVAVDQQQGMLDSYADAAARRGVSAQLILGDWPPVAPQVPQCDVVVCHHVMFNVPDIEPFLVELNAHARRRVVIEMPMWHPQTSMNPLWPIFWGIERPSHPTAYSLASIASALGFDARIQVWPSQTWGRRTATREEQVRFARVRLCLPEEREAEVDAVLDQQDLRNEMATVWWDVR